MVRESRCRFMVGSTAKTGVELPKTCSLSMIDPNPRFFSALICGACTSRHGGNCRGSCGANLGKENCVVYEERFLVVWTGRFLGCQAMLGALGQALRRYLEWFEASFVLLLSESWTPSLLAFWTTARSL